MLLNLKKFTYLSRTLIDDASSIAEESSIAEALTAADYEYNLYATPFHEEIPDLDIFFGKDEYIISVESLQYFHFIQY